MSILDHHPPAPTLSIIMPVYNIRPWLETAVISVLQQKSDGWSFEILLIDDGSDDGSENLIETLALADHRIRVFHQPNLGPAAARNTGLQYAQGNWIGFVDGDDWIESDMYQLLLGNAVRMDVPLSACAFVKIRDRDALKFSSTAQPPVRLNAETALGHMFEKQHMRYSCCNKLFRRDLFNTIRYPDFRIMEDKATTYRLIDAAKYMAWCPSAKYHYYMRQGSIMHGEIERYPRELFEINDTLLTFIKAFYPRLLSTARASYAEECVKLLELLTSPDLKGSFGLGSTSSKLLLLDQAQQVLRQNLLQGLLSKNLPAATKWHLLKKALF